MTDSVGGAGTATGTLAQHGSTAGGALTDVETGATVTAQLSLTINSANALSGAMVIDYPGGATCTFKTTGTYSNNGSSSATITGSYTAVTNCTGQTGTFALNQQCVDTVTSARRRMSYPPQC